MKTGILNGVNEDAYHADPCEVPSLSQSIAHKLINESPRHAWAAHPKLGNLDRKATATMDRGSLIHKLVLGEGAEVTIIDAPDWRTKAAKEAREAAREARQIPVLLADFNDAEQAATEVRKQLAALGIALGDRSEVPVQWIEHASDGTEVQCRGMIDNIASPTIYDLKTCRSAHPRAIERHAITYGYHIQAAAYRRAWEAINPELAGRVEFVWIFVQLDPLPVITVARPRGTMRELGERQWRRAVDTWARCLREDRWPGYADGIVEIEAPAWALSQDYEQFNDDSEEEAA